MKYLGKRLIFGIISVICITVMACYLKLEGEIIIKLITTVCGLYVVGQTVTDVRNGVK